MSPARQLRHLAAATGAALTLNFAACSSKAPEAETAPPKGMSVAEWNAQSSAAIESFADNPSQLSAEQQAKCTTAANALNAHGQQLSAETMQLATTAITAFGTPAGDKARQGQAENVRQLGVNAQRALKLQTKCNLIG